MSFVERKYYFSSVNVEQMKANIVYLYYTMSKNIARNFKSNIYLFFSSHSIRVSVQSTSGF